MDPLPYILENKIIAIIRGVEAWKVLPIVQALYTGGIRVVEITLNSENPFEIIRELAIRMKGKTLIGAGTVMDIPSAEMAIQHGARFIISPMLDNNLIKFVKGQGLVSIPGAFTATEIVAAHWAGADIVKVFPAPDSRYIHDLTGPFPHIRFMPTGGIHENNIAAFRMAGAVAFGVGSALVSAGQKISTDALSQLTSKAEGLIHALTNHTES